MNNKELIKYELELYHKTIQLSQKDSSLHLNLLQQDRKDPRDYALACEVHFYQREVKEFLQFLNENVRPFNSKEKVIREIEKYIPLQILPEHLSNELDKQIDSLLQRKKGGLNIIQISYLVGNIKGRLLEKGKTT